MCNFFKALDAGKLAGVYLESGLGFVTSIRIKVDSHDKMALGQVPTQDGGVQQKVKAKKWAL